MIKLGSKVKDKVSQAIGIATAKTEFLNGCIKYTVQPPVDKEGKFVNELWFDEQQLEVIEESSVQTESRPTGGPSGVISSSQSNIPN